MTASASPPFADNQANALSSAIGWITGTVTGSIAAGLCVIAVAAVGFMMMTGRVPVRQGVRVILGCFVLLGAPMIAAALMGLARNEPAPPPPPSSQTDPRGDLPPANYDPYAGASLRQD